MIYRLCLPRRQVQCAGMRFPISQTLSVMEKIAMKLEEGERLISVQPCSEKNDVLLATRDGKAIRFGVSDVRVFRSRGSMGVRGIKLINGDAVVGMSILVRVEHETPKQQKFQKEKSI